MRSSNSRISFSSKAFSRDSIGMRWATCPNFSSGAPPTRLVGRFRGDQFGKILFKLDQLAEQEVVLRIGDFRLVLDVVEIVVVFDLPAQFLDPLFRFGSCPSASKPPFTFLSASGSAASCYL